MIRYYGIYANAARGKRKKMKHLGAPEVVEADFEERSAYRRYRWPPNTVKSHPLTKGW